MPAECIFDIMPKNCVFMTIDLRTLFLWCESWGPCIFDVSLGDCVFWPEDCILTSDLKSVFFFLSLFWRGRFQIHFIVKAKTLKCSFKFENFMKICYSLIVSKIEFFLLVYFLVLIVFLFFCWWFSAFWSTNRYYLCDISICLNDFLWLFFVFVVFEA